MKPFPFGPYLMLERLAIGGMAEVWLAKNKGAAGFEKLVAVKRILPNIAEDQEFITMFVDEAKIAGQLAHANIAQIFDLGKINQTYYIAMEYIPGVDVRSLWERVRNRGGFPLSMACYIVGKLCEGLDYAHRRKDNRGKPLGIIHRDVSPQNVLIGFEGDVKIIDFGIAKAASRSTRTQTGILKGKFAYMAPEQARGQAMDHRSDIFAIGVILHELITGERLFRADSDFSLLEKVRKAEVGTPRAVRPDTPPELERVVMKALAGRPEDRYSWASALQADLERFLVSSRRNCTREDLAQFIKDHFPENFKAEQQRQKLAQEVAMTPEGEVVDAGLPAKPKGEGTTLFDTGEVEVLTSSDLQGLSTGEVDQASGSDFSDATSVGDHPTLPPGSVPVTDGEPRAPAVHDEETPWHPEDEGDAPEAFDDQKATRAEQPAAVVASSSGSKKSGKSNAALDTRPLPDMPVARRAAASEKKPAPAPRVPTRMAQDPPPPVDDDEDALPTDPRMAELSAADLAGAVAGATMSEDDSLPVPVRAPIVVSSPGNAVRKPSAAERKPAAEERKPPVEERKPAAVEERKPAVEERKPPRPATVARPVAAPPKAEQPVPKQSLRNAPVQEPEQDIEDMPTQDGGRSKSGLSVVSDLGMERPSPTSSFPSLPSIPDLSAVSANSADVVVEAPAPTHSNPSLARKVPVASPLERVRAAPTAEVSIHSAATNPRNEISDAVAPPAAPAAGSGLKVFLGVMLGLTLGVGLMVVLLVTPVLGRGAVVIISGSETAQVVVEERPTQRGSVVAMMLPIGSRKITILREGFKPDIQLVDIKNMDVTLVNFSAAPTKGTLRVVTVPAGATVLIDGKRLPGTTPILDAELPTSGEHEMVLRHPETQEKRVKVVAQEGAALNVERTLDFNVSRVVLETDPEDAGAMEGRDFKGKKGSLKVKMGGKATFKVVRPGCDPSDVEVVGKGEQIITEKVTLKCRPFDAEVSLRTPVGAGLSIDGIETGLVLPVEDYKLPQGVHKFMLVSKGKAPEWEQRIQPGPQNLSTR